MPGRTALRPLDLRRRQWLTVVAVAAYVVVAATGLAALVAVGADPVAVAVLAVVAVGALVLTLARVLDRTSSTARRLAAETRVIVDVNPSLRLDPVGAGELYLLAASVNRLAERREAAERDVAGQVAVARREVEAERNRLAALMAELSVAVVVCNTEGRILLYNEAARDVVGDDTLLGLGRSVFGIVDRGLVTHAMDRIGSGTEPAPAATTVRGDRLLHVRVALVRDPGADAASGFVLVLDDLTAQVRAGQRREARLRELTEATRASLGSIRAAVESILDFPDLRPEERRGFLEIVHDEAERLGSRVDGWAAEWAEPTDDRVRTDMTGADLLTLLGQELGRGALPVRLAPVAEDPWLRVDGHAVSRVLVHLATRLRDRVVLDDVTLSLAEGAHGVQLDLRWRGDPPAMADFAQWSAEPLAGPGSATARDVVDRHGGELWSATDVGGTAYVRLLLPASERRPVAPATGRRTPASRPEYYDFDLFSARPQADGWHERRLDELSFTVLDTETTGLDPAAGDRVVSLAAVRVVHGRLLRHETFERLVDPGRPVPAASTAIHGITDAMVAGQPRLTDVLPAFAAFARDTVLVGHDVGFDLRFLRSAEGAAGVRLDQPVLDTLLLDAALHPDHDDHTLEAIAERLGVSVVGRHTALGDALVTGEVLVGLLALLRRRGVTTLGEAVEATRETFRDRVDEVRYGR